MKQASKSIILLLAIPFFMVACNKKGNSSAGQENWWACHHEKAWNATKTKRALIGEWEWEYGGNCDSDSGVFNYSSSKGLTIVFKSDNTLSVKQNGQIIQSSHWEVVDGDADLFALNVEPAVDALYGRILFCDGSVLFDNSYVDGCDNIFKRKK